MLNKVVFSVEDMWRAVRLAQAVIVGFEMFGSGFW